MEVCLQAESEGGKIAELPTYGILRRVLQGYIALVGRKPCGAERRAVVGVADRCTIYSGEVAVERIIAHGIGIIGGINEFRAVEPSRAAVI